MDLQLIRLAGVLVMLLSALASANADLPPTYELKPNPAADAIFARWDTTISPGCSAAAAKNGKLIYSRGYGMANLDHGVPITPRTTFHVASVSKQFTAAAIVLLAQEGKLSLDDDVRKYLPEAPDLGTTITLRQMIHHTSGLRDQWDLLSLAGWRYSEDRITDDDVLRLMSRQRKLNFAPDSQFLYSNLGYTLLAQVVKRVSGRSLREFTTERIFEPLQMSQTHFRDDYAELVPGFANGYRRAGDSFRTSVTNFDTTGATGLVTTAEDLLRWDENFYTGQVGGPRFIEQMLERATLSDGETLTYAFGLTHGDYRGARTVSHSGSDAGYRATLRRFPEHHVGIAVLCNVAEALPEQLADGMADVLLASALQPKQEPTTRKVNVGSIRDKTGAYLNRVDGQVLRLVEKDGALHWMDTEGSVRPLTALGPDRFRVDPLPVVLEFAGVGAQSTIRTRIYDQKPSLFQRVPEFKPSAAELNEYAGRFGSEELDVRYALGVADGKLYLRTLKRNPLPLQPLTKDVFVAPLGTLMFQRDDADHISGFTVSTSRAWANEFGKLE